MANKSVLQSASDAVKSFFEQRKKEEAERNRAKNYQDLMEYAAKTSAPFPQNVKITPLETAAPYYGEDVSSQLAAASQYAEQLAQQQAPRVTVNPEYYDLIKQQIPVTQDSFSGYTHDEKRMVLQSPRDIQKTISPLSNVQRYYAGYGTKAQTADYLAPENALQVFRDVAEHEAFHSLDKQINFLDKDIKNQGYMATNEHIPTGLAKVQREQYAMTGKRFESPDEFKSFIVNLAQSQNPEEAMSGFTEEAKRALRTQVGNIRSDIRLIPFFMDDPAKLEKYDFGKRIKPKLDFLEKSAQLIPALVEYRQASQPTA
jgi:hypothetical protein